MAGRLTLLAALLAVAAGLVVSPSAIGSAGGSVQIDLSGGPQGGNPESGGGRFAMRTRTAKDAGLTTYTFSFPGSGKTAAGQSFARVKGLLYLNGKVGQLVLSTRGQGFGAAGDGVVSGRDVWTGTWTVVSGTQAYAGMKGSGSYVGIAGPSARVALRLNGHLG